MVALIWAKLSYYVQEYLHNFSWHFMSDGKFVKYAYNCQLLITLTINYTHCSAQMINNFKIFAP